MPDVLEAVVSHPEVDAVVLLGVGIQSNQGGLERRGPFYPEHGLERIVAFHDRQDRRYVTVAGELSTTYDKPVVIATELAIVDPDNAAVAGLREQGRYCFPSAERAVAALDRLRALGQWRSNRALDTEPR